MTYTSTQARSLLSGHGMGQDVPGVPPPGIPAGMLPADFWQFQQYGTTVIPRPAPAGGDLSSQIIRFSEQNMVWIVGGVVAFVVLMLVMGGGGRR